MSEENQVIDRVKVISGLVGASPNPLGRTAIMKFVYFLQTLRAVPLGYRFTLYTYGPFDSEVLSDLSVAESEGYVKSEQVTYPNGSSGYQIRPTSSAWRRKVEALDEKADIEWVIRRFGSYSASDLEMASTIVFVDRSNRRKRRVASPRDVADRVYEIKPHLSKEKIENEAVALETDGLLVAVG